MINDRTCLYKHIHANMKDSESVVTLENEQLLQLARLWPQRFKRGQFPLSMSNQNIKRFLQLNQTFIFTSSLWREVILLVGIFSVSNNTQSGHCHKIKPIRVIRSQDRSLTTLNGVYFLLMTYILLITEIMAKQMNIKINKELFDFKMTLSCM